MVNIEAVKNKKKNGAHICTTYSNEKLGKPFDSNFKEFWKTFEEGRYQKAILENFEKNFKKGDKNNFGEILKKYWRSYF